MTESSVALIEPTVTVTLPPNSPRTVEWSVATREPAASNAWFWASAESVSVE
ncbi:conserved hypothetical protein [Ricinus communis]|uniref:Uncharacterized protein n=1 Tax=Ricinus communis TaxID=3988 RepID=B9T987_RICCO|nr:conserved hypothetical protein [Ricinus communis]